MIYLYSLDSSFAKVPLYLNIDLNIANIAEDIKDNDKYIV